MRYEAGYAPKEFLIPQDFEVGLRGGSGVKEPNIFDLWHNGITGLTNMTSVYLPDYILLAAGLRLATLLPDYLRDFPNGTAVPPEGVAVLLGLLAFGRKISGKVFNSIELQKRMDLVPQPYTEVHGEDDVRWIIQQINALCSDTDSPNKAFADPGKTVWLESANKSVVSFARAHNGIVRRPPIPKRPSRIHRWVSPLDPNRSYFFPPTGEIAIATCNDQNPVTHAHEMTHAQIGGGEPPTVFASIAALLDYGNPYLRIIALETWLNIIIFKSQMDQWGGLWSNDDPQIGIRNLLATQGMSEDLLAMYDGNLSNTQHDMPTSPSRPQGPNSKLGAIFSRVRETAFNALYPSKAQNREDYTDGPLALLHAWRVQYRNTPST